MSFLDNFDLPLPEGVELPQMRGVAAKGGVTRFEGDNAGLPFRFFEKKIYNEDRSKDTGKLEEDNFEMIEYEIDPFNKPIYIVTDEHKERHPEAYLRFKQGVEAPGTPLNSCDFISNRELKILNDGGIFTLEQFAAMPKNSVRAKFHSSISTLHDRACQWVNTNSTAGSKDVKALEEKNLRLEQEMEALKAMVSGFVQAQSAAPKPTTRSRSKKTEVISEEK